MIALLSALEGDTPRKVPLLSLTRTRRSPAPLELALLLKPLALPILALWGLYAATWIVRRTAAPAVGITAGVTALFAAAVIYDQPIWLRGPAPSPEGWRWSYQVLDSTGRWAPAIAASVASLVILALLYRARTSPLVRVYSCVWLAAATISGLAFQLSLLHFEPNGATAALAERTLSDDITSYFNVAATDPRPVRQQLASYAADMPRRDRHASSHPPGPIVYYRTVIDIFRRFPGLTEAVFSGLERTGIERAQVTGGRTIDDALLVAAIVGGFGLACSAALTLWPVTAIAWAAGADLTTAAQVGVLSTFIPAPVLFSPQFDQMVTLLVAAACAFACVAMRSTGRTARAGAALAAGAVAGAAVFCSFGAVPMLATGGVLAVLVAPKSLRTWRAIGEVAVVAVLGLSVVSLLPILSGYDFFLTMREALGVSRYQYEVKRSYSLWLRFNLLDFMYFFGPPLVAWGALGVLRDRARHGQDAHWRLDCYAAVAASIFLLDASGVIRGEVGRIWMPFMPLALVASLPLFVSSEAERSVRLAETMVIAALLATVAVTLRLYWDPA